MSVKHPVDPPPEWDPTWDDSQRTPGPLLGLLDPEEGRTEMSKPVKRPGIPGASGASDAPGGANASGGANSPEPTTTPTAPRNGTASGNTTPDAAATANPRDWIYGQLGLSRDKSDDDPARPTGPTGPTANAPQFAYDYQPSDSTDQSSPFPPGSLGGGGTEPETRVFHGFPKPGTGGGLSSAEPTTPTAPSAPSAPTTPSVPRPAARATDAVDNPFRAYDERAATANTPLAPANKARRDVLPPTPAEVSQSMANTADRLTAADLDPEKVLRRRRRVARRGWRKGLLAASGGVINVGPSGRERRDVDFGGRVQTPITACHRLAMISLKGGVGKTTTTAALGSVFAALRTDRVIAVDANPDRGTLGDKVVTDRPNATVRDFVRRAPQLDRYSAVREITGMANSRLEVLASETDPLASTQFSEHDYRIIADILERYYNLILTDCGTGLMHSAMVGVLAKADQVVIVSTASLDGARSASATLDWLEAHGYGDLARESVTVITSVRPKASTVDLDEIVAHFARRTRAVVAIPHDEHLAAGGQIDLRQMSRGAYEAHLQLAAEIADAFV
jgi:MinD-like ATPase involved in chromosome partitioning or flagellar assembly